LRDACRVPEQAASVLSTTFMLWLVAESGWILRPLASTTTRIPQDGTEVLAQAAMFAALAAALAVTHWMGRSGLPWAPRPRDAHDTGST